MNPRLTKSFAAKAALSVVSIAFLEIVCAVLFRLFFWTPEPAHFDPELGWTAIPGWHGVRRGAHFPMSFNDWGVRDPFRSLDEIKNKKRVLVLGNSITFAQHVPLEETFVKRLQDKFSQRYAAYFINAGMDGYDLQQEAILFDRDLWKLKPAVVLCVVGVGNFCQTEENFRHSMQITIGLHDSLRKRNPFEYSFAYQLFKSLFPPPVQGVASDAEKSFLIKAMDGAGDDYERTYLMKMKAIAEKIGATFIVTLTPIREMARERGQYRYEALGGVATLEKNCRDLNIPFLNAIQTFVEDRTLGDELFLDHVHFSSLGHRWFASAISGQLRPYLSGTTASE